MEKVLNQFLQKQIYYGNIKEEEQSIYLFGLKQIIIYIINVMTTILIGIVMGRVLEALLILILFIPLRTSAGGYHANHRSSCFIFSSLLIIGMLWWVKVFNWSKISMLLIGIVCGGIIWILSPVEDANKPLCELECRVYRKRTRIILLGEIVLMLILSQVMERKSLVLCIEGVLLGETLLLVLGKWKLMISKRTQVDAL